LEKHPDVAAVSPNYRLRIDAVTPNDPFYSNLWGMNNTGQSGGTPGIDINAPDAWQAHTGSSGVIVAVVDSGIDYNHYELNANMWVNPGETAGNSIDDDGNGYVDDVYGINSITGSGDPMDDNDHGTHCAGTIGAVGNNSLGVVGVNWTVSLMAVKFLDAGGGGWTSDAVESIDYVVDMKTTYGQNIAAINASWGGGGWSATLKSAIDAAGTALIIFCASSREFRYRQ
jgi:subtilisin family serine protease